VCECVNKTPKMAQEGHKEGEKADVFVYFHLYLLLFIFTTQQRGGGGRLQNKYTKIRTHTGRREKRGRTLHSYSEETKKGRQDFQIVCEFNAIDTTRSSAAGQLCGQTPRLRRETTSLPRPPHSAPATEMHHAETRLCRHRSRPPQLLAGALLRVRWPWQLDPLLEGLKTKTSTTKAAVTDDAPLAEAVVPAGRKSGYGVAELTTTARAPPTTPPP
jgi:hypothetical protein